MQSPGRESFSGKVNLECSLLGERVFEGKLTWRLECNLLGERVFQESLLGVQSPGGESFSGKVNLEHKD